MVAAQIVEVGCHSRKIAAVSLDPIFDHVDVGAAVLRHDAVGQVAINDLARDRRP